MMLSKPFSAIKFKRVTIARSCWVMPKYLYACIVSYTFSNSITASLLQKTIRLIWCFTSLPTCMFCLATPTSKFHHWLISITWSTDTWISILLKEIEYSYHVRHIVNHIEGLIIMYKTGKGLSCKDILQTSRPPSKLEDL